MKTKLHSDCSKSLKGLLWLLFLLPSVTGQLFAQCTAGFTNTISGSTVNFTNTCSGAVTPFYYWNFGDGNYSSSANPSHTFSYNGTYNVCLQYYGDSTQPACSANFCDTVVIIGGSNPPCNATFTAYMDSSNPSNPIIQFYNQSAYNAQWLWDFGDGNTSAAQNPTHQYSINATYSVCLTAITTLGDSCTFCDTINSTPCAQLLTTSFIHTFNGNPVSFTAICSGASNPYYYWDFGDGNTSAVQNTSHSYQYNGTYNVCLAYQDSGGFCTGNFCDTVNITNAGNPPCNLSFIHSPDSSLPQPGKVIFNYYSSIQPTQWFWNFGDGNTSTQQNPIHTYSTSGSYSVCLSVVRSIYGDTCIFCDTVNILIPGYLSGSVFSDANSNCVKDAGDNSMANWIVKALDVPSSTTYYGISNSAGNYTVAVPAGNYIVSLTPLNNYWTQVCPVSPSTYSVSVAQQATVNNLNFGMQAVVSCADLTVGLGSTNQRRCLTNNYFVVQVSNNGTITASNVLLKVDFDPPLGRVIPLSSTLPWDSISGTEYFWKLGTMISGQSISFTVNDSVSCFAAVGDTLYAEAFISPTLGDCDLNNNSIEDFKTITGSYDPNEKKAVTTSNKIYITQGYILATDTIDYHIGFQNTGNDTAFTVTVFDTLDSDLNIQSVISGVSTHAYTFEILGANVLKWTFNNILLPDSNINEPLSHGFFKFRILQKPNNPFGTVIKNSAGIVFDFNVPVITDTVVLTVGTPIGVPDAKGENNTISIFPNPTNGAFTIKSSEKILSLEIMNVMGEKLTPLRLSPKGESVVVTLPLGLGQEIYFVRIKTGQGTAVKKIIVQK